MAAEDDVGRRPNGAVAQLSVVHEAAVRGLAGVRVQAELKEAEEEKEESGGLHLKLEC